MTPADKERPPAKKRGVARWAMHGVHTMAAPRAVLRPAMNTKRKAMPKLLPVSMMTMAKCFVVAKICGQPLMNEGEELPDQKEILIK